MNTLKYTGKHPPVFKIMQDRAQATANQNQMIFFAIE